MDSRSDYLKGVVFVSLATLCFAFQPVFGHLAQSDETSVITLLWLRFFITAGVLHLFCFRFTTRNWHRPFVIGVLFSLGSICYFSALRSLSIGMTTLLFFLFPVYIFLLSVLLRYESLSWLKVLAVSLAATGVWVSVELDSGFSTAGLLMGLAAGASYGIYIMLSNRYLGEENPFNALRWVATGAAVCLSVPMLVEGEKLPTSISGMGAAVGLSLICTLLSMVLLLAGTRLMQRSSDVSIIASTEIGTTLLLAWLLLDTLITQQELMGSLLIFIAATLIVLVQRKESRQLKSYACNCQND